MLQGRYQIEQEIGSGAHGRVYRGRDLLTTTPVAIKHLRPAVIAVEPEILGRFHREAEALRRLNHPNIVQAITAFAEGDEHYIVMEYLSGGSLRTLMDEAPSLTLDRVLRLALDISDALTRAHRLNIIHRDLKPANVLLAEDGTPRLTDFGVALMRDQERVTDSNSVVGTLHYISPEALNGDSVDASADIWSFGVMVYEMLAGRRPFVTPNPTSLIAAILTQPPDDLEALRPDAPASLVDLVYRMLDKNPRTRVASVRRIGAELEAILHEIETGETHLPLKESPGAPPATAQFEIVPPIKNNLPAQSTPFVGRDWEIDELLTLLTPTEANRANRPRLVTLLATGGMGKSRLSLEVASRLLTITNQPPYPDGIYFVALAPLSSADRIPYAIAEMVGYGIQNDGREPITQIEAFLSTRQILLILDNFEHLTSGADMVTRLLSAAPHLTLLVTSRERLNLSAEYLFSLEGLATPPDNAPASPMEYSAIRLFVQTAQRTSPKFKLETADVPYVSTICRLVQGLPLGLVLAATWAEMLTPKEIATELSQSVEFLEANLQDLPERHRSMRAVFEYSWQRLSPVEQRTLARLSVFRGSFSRSAAQAVTESSLRDLMQLVNKSLLYRDVETGHYDLHELIRQFAAAQLKQTPSDSEAAHRAHARYYCFWLKELHSAALGPQMQAVIPMDAEIDNIRQAWQWAVAHKDVAALGAAEETLYVYYRVRSLEGERLPMFTGAVNALETVEPSPERDSALGRLHARQGELFMRLLDMKSAEQSLRCSIALLRETDPIGLIYALTHMAELLSRREANSAASEALFDEALTLAQTHHARAYEAMICVWKGFRFNRDYRMEEGLEWASRGFVLCQEVQNPEGMGDSQRVLALICQQMGKAQTAIEHFAAAIPHYTTIRDWSGVIVCAVGQATSYAFMGDYTSARRTLRHMESVMDEHGLNIRKTQMYTLMGDIAYQEGHLDESLRHLQAAARHSDYVGIGAFAKMFSMAYQARTLTALGRYHEADELLKPIEEILSNKEGFRTGNSFRLFPMSARGQWYTAQARYDEAETQYLATIASIFKEGHDLPSLPYVLGGLAEVWQKQGKSDAAGLAALLVRQSPLTWASDRVSAQNVLDAIRPTCSIDEWASLERKAAETPLIAYAQALLKRETN